MCAMDMTPRRCRVMGGLRSGVRSLWSFLRRLFALSVLPVQFCPALEDGRGDAVRARLPNATLVHPPRLAVLQMQKGCALVAPTHLLLLRPYGLVASRWD